MSPIDGLVRFWLSKVICFLVVALATIYQYPSDLEGTGRLHEDSAKWLEDSQNGCFAPLHGVS